MTQLEGCIVGIGILIIALVSERGGRHEQAMIFGGIALLIVFVSIALEDQ